MTQNKVDCNSHYHTYVLNFKTRCVKNHEFHLFMLILYVASTWLLPNENGQYIKMYPHILTISWQTSKIIIDNRLSNPIFVSSIYATPFITKLGASPCSITMINGCLANNFDPGLMLLPLFHYNDLPRSINACYSPFRSTGRPSSFQDYIVFLF